MSKILNARMQLLRGVQRFGASKEEMVDNFLQKCPLAILRGVALFTDTGKH
jgi:hypothetical protein